MKFTNFNVNLQTFLYVNRYYKNALRGIFLLTENCINAIIQLEEVYYLTNTVDK